MAEHTMGSAEAIEMLEAIITRLHEDTFRHPSRCRHEAH